MLQDSRLEISNFLYHHSDSININLILNEVDFLANVFSPRVISIQC